MTFCFDALTSTLCIEAEVFEVMSISGKQHFIYMFFMNWVKL
ncbi:hypothetical protein QY97_00906 [Bacillus thermotolerans]|nr:hypothetical protein QY97_00906 [Bacillus thermotolerans]